jgi:hypothetical protein
MHKKYAKDDFVAFSVSLDDPSDPKAMGRVHDFLKAQKATFRNFVLDEEPEAWMKGLGIAGPPAIFVFDRDGKLANKSQTYEEVQRVVKELIEKKKP